MIKVEIELNENKIRQENIYVPESIMKTLDNAFVSKNQKILEADRFRRVYRDSGDPGKDFGILGGLVIGLAKTEWFGDNVSKIIWYNSENGESEEDFHKEDFLSTLRTRRVGVFANE